jgi:hypothetical protein
MIVKIFNKILNREFFPLSFFLKKFLITLNEKKIYNLSIKTLVDLNLSERPHYLYCLYHSAILAKKLGIKKISVIEFGVAGGNGIVFLESYQKKIYEEIGVEIEIYGFDLGSGLSKPEDYRDLPYWFKEGFFKMNSEKLNKKLKSAKIIIGDVKITITDFFKQYNPSPIGAIFNDLDYYTSTKNSFEIFKNGNDNYYLPRIFCYFDDVIGTEREMYGTFNGELLAIQEFNDENKNKKIVLNQCLISKEKISYKFQIYYYHNFQHKDYNKFIYNEEQFESSKYLMLK